MTEAEWQGCDNPWRMLDFLSARVSERKLRLFAVACCRQPALFHFWRAQDEAAVHTAEGYAEGQADLDQLRQAGRAAWSMGPAWCCAETGGAAARQWAASADRYGAWSASRRALLAGLLRELFGPEPLRPVTIERGWIAWNSRTVPRLAQAAYEERQLPSGRLDNAHLAVLADALEEAGCPDPRILGHLRSSGEHVRGCHVLDALLAKT
jgi:hypothetical protein